MNRFCLPLPAKHFIFTFPPLDCSCPTIGNWKCYFSTWTSIAGISPRFPLLAVITLSLPSFFSINCLATRHKFTSEPEREPAQRSNGNWEIQEPKPSSLHPSKVQVARHKSICSSENSMGLGLMEWTSLELAYSLARFQVAPNERSKAKSTKSD